MIAMKNQLFKLAGAVIACAVISACSSSDNSTPPLNSGTPSAGDADFTTFVAIGDSLTAGYADGTLYLLGQQNSFPAILAGQFAGVDGGEFNQPLVADDLTDPASIASGNLGGLVVGGNPIEHPVTMKNLYDTRFALNTETQLPERLEGPSTIEVTNVLTGMFNNMGIPGMKSFHLVTPGYGDLAGLSNDPVTANPYYVRFSQDPLAQMVLNDIVSQAPSFFTLWVNNDVLLYAVYGGFDDFNSAPAKDQTGFPDPADAKDNEPYGVYDITDPDLFALAYDLVLKGIKGSNKDAKGVLINIPDIKTIPYFTVVPYNAIPLTQEEADQLNAAYAPYNAGLELAVAGGFIDEAEAALRTINFVEGQNAVVLLDDTLTNIGAPNMRQATAEDLITFDAAAKLGTEAVEGDPTTVWGVGTPLLNGDVLIKPEVEAVEKARLAYNATIENFADNDDNLIMLDADALLSDLNANGSDYGTGSVTADFATGGFYSLDGIHMTGRGAAVFANYVVDAINAGFNANVYKADPGTYPAVLLK